jgi:hypothetical protein
MSNIDLGCDSTDRPSITRVAIVMKLNFMIFDTNGKLRDARRLHSMTFTWLSLPRNCMLNGPDMFSSRAILAAMWRIWRMVSR